MRALGKVEAARRPLQHASPIVRRLAGGRVNLPLQQPELYDIEQDPTEAYDAAPENPAVVAEITGRIDRLIDGFPEEVKHAWSQTRAPSDRGPAGWRATCFRAREIAVRHARGIGRGIARSGHGNMN